MRHDDRNDTPTDGPDEQRDETRADERERGADGIPLSDEVDEEWDAIAVASDQSFPASDPPGWSRGA